MLSDVTAGDPPVRTAQVEHGQPTTHELEAQGDRDRLGDHGRERGSAHTPLQRPDHQDDEPDVQGARHGEEHQRGLGISDRTDDRGEIVEEHRRARAEEADLGEDRGLGHQLGRRLQQREDRTGEEGRSDRQDHTRDGAQQNTGRDRTAHGGVIPRAEGLGDRDRETARQSPGEPEQQEQQAAGRADRREGGDAEVPTDDDGIGELVQLLHHVPEQKGDGEGKDDAPRAARGERGGHEGAARRTGGDRGATSLSNRFGATEYRISIPSIARSTGTFGSTQSTTTGGRK